MPIYAYKCESCGHAKDVLQKMSDDLLTICPACGAATFVKQLTAAGFQLKGSGWYATDFKGGPASPAAAPAAVAADSAASAAPAANTGGTPSTPSADSSSGGISASATSGSSSASSSASSCGASCACH
jgi:putative FmdB family regulatory protein